MIGRYINAVVFKHFIVILILRFFFVHYIITTICSVDLIKIYHKCLLSIKIHGESIAYPRVLSLSYDVVISNIVSVCIAYLNADWWQMW